MTFEDIKEAYVKVALQYLPEEWNKAQDTPQRALIEACAMAFAYTIIMLRNHDNEVAKKLLGPATEAMRIRREKEEGSDDKGV